MSVQADPEVTSFVGGSTANMAVKAEEARSGWWILPFVVLGAVLWATLIAWAFGFG